MLETANLFYVKAIQPIAVMQLPGMLHGRIQQNHCSTGAEEKTPSVVAISPNSFREFIAATNSSCHGLRELAAQVSP